MPQTSRLDVAIGGGRRSSVTARLVSTFGADSRSGRVIRNIALSSGVKVANILTTMAVIPVTLRYLRSAEYGVWLTLSSILAWISIFDVGLGNGLRNRLAEALALGDQTRAREYVSTTAALLAMMVGIFFLAFECANPFLGWVRILNAPQELAPELVNVAAIVFGCLCLQFVLKVVGTILMANQMSWLSDLMGALGNVGALVSLVALTRLHPHGHLLPVAFIYGFTPVAVMGLFSIWLFWRRFPGLRPGFSSVHFEHTRDLMGIGIQFFVIQMVGLVVYMSSNLLISQFSSPGDVVKYNIAYRYMSPLNMAFTIVLTPLWTAYTDAYRRGDHAWIRRTMGRTGLMASGFAGIGLVMVLLSGFVYRIWIGPSVDIPFQLTLALALFFALSNVAGVAVMFLNGIGALRVQLWAGVLSAAIHVPLSMFLTRRIGFSGVAWSMCITTACSSCIVYSQTISLLKVSSNQTNKT